MLGKRVITALVLLAVLLLILYIGSFAVFALALAVAFCAATWEGARLFGSKHPRQSAALWTAAFLFIAFRAGDALGAPQVTVPPTLLLGAAVALWLVRFVPSLAIGLPALGTWANRGVSGMYGIAILACFVAMLDLFRHSTLYLFSVLALVWIADIGAYFTGKAFGKRKLAPSISPGKSWEGAVGGWLAVLLLASLSTLYPVMRDTFAAQMQLAWGWFGLVPVLTVIVAASVVGDLFESLLKRRIGMKDSSSLLPGHGGVLDRIDALIPVLPLAVLFAYWMQR